jgi:hypothetical protein
LSHRQGVGCDGRRQGVEVEFLPGLQEGDSMKPL